MTIALLVIIALLLGFIAFAVNYNSEIVRAVYDLELRRDELARQRDGDARQLADAANSRAHDEAEHDAARRQVKRLFLPSTEGPWAAVGSHSTWRGPSARPLEGYHESLS